MNMLRLLAGGLLSVLAVVAVRGDALTADLSCVPCGYGGGGRFTALAVDPRDPLTVLAGSDVAGVFKSTDGGDSFALAGRGLDSFAIAAIAFHPELARPGLYPYRQRTVPQPRLRSKLAPDQRHGGFPGTFFRQQPAGFFRRLCVGRIRSRRRVQDCIDTEMPRQSSPYRAWPMPGYAAWPCTGVGYMRPRRAACSALKSGRWHALGRGLPAGGSEIIDLAAHASGRLYAVSKNHGVYRLDDETQRWIGIRAAYAPDISGRPHVIQGPCRTPAGS